MKSDSYPVWNGFAHLSAGLTCGLAALAAGIAIGITGDAATRAIAREPKLFIGMILILVFGEVLGLYGMIISILLCSNMMSKHTCVY